MLAREQLSFASLQLHFQLYALLKLVNLQTPKLLHPAEYCSAVEGLDEHEKLPRSLMICRSVNLKCIYCVK